MIKGLKKIELLEAILLKKKKKTQTDFASNFVETPIQVCRGASTSISLHPFSVVLFFQFQD